MSPMIGDFYITLNPDSAAKGITTFTLNQDKVKGIEAGFVTALVESTNGSPDMLHGPVCEIRT